MSHKKEIYCGQCHKRIKLKYAMLPQKCEECHAKFELHGLENKKDIIQTILWIIGVILPIGVVIEIIRPVLKGTTIISIVVYALLLFVLVMWSRAVLGLLTQYGLYTCENIILK